MERGGAAFISKCVVTLGYRCLYCFFFSSRRRHTRFDCDWSSDVCSSDLPSCREASRCTRYACRRGRISTRNITVNREPLTPGASPGSPTNRDPLSPGSRPGSANPVPEREAGSRRGRMLAESAVVEEMPVWLEVNGEPAVTWMCTPDQLEELATGGLHGEGYIQALGDLVKLPPVAPRPGV